MKNENVLKQIAYIAIVLYILDIILLGGGNLTKIGGVSTRILFFAIAILACVPGMLKDFKKYVTNRYCLSVGIFMLFVAVALAIGILNGNSRVIMITDIKGFLNILRSKRRVIRAMVTCSLSNIEEIPIFLFGQINYFVKHNFI